MITKRTGDCACLACGNTTAAITAENTIPKMPVRTLRDFRSIFIGQIIADEIRWDEKAGLRTGCGVRSQVIDVLEAQEIKETGNEEG